MILKKIMSKIIPVVIKKQLKNFYTLSIKYGQFYTIKKSKCIDKYGNKIPWYTYPAIEYLNNIDFSEKIIFEYGSGNSSIFWAKRAKKLYSVEHNENWYNQIKNNVSDNQMIMLNVTEDAYLQAISTVLEKVDVIIIDGLYREKCAKRIKDYLSNDGIIILDNSDWYKETAKYLRNELDLIEVDFHGFGPINDYTWTTSIFFTRQSKLKPIDNSQPYYSISAIECHDEKFY